MCMCACSVNFMFFLANFLTSHWNDPKQPAGNSQKTERSPETSRGGKKNTC